MELHSLLQSDYLDILFDNRNKAYGGYELRRHYSRRMNTATLAMLLTAAAVAFLLMWNNRETITRIIDVMPQTPTNLAQIQPLQPPLPPVIPTTAFQPPKVKMEAFTTLKIVTDKDIKPDDQVVDMNQLKNAQAGPQHADGNETGTPANIPEHAGNGPAGNGITPPVATPFKYVQQMPAFDNISGYLSTHLRYPDVARDNGIQGKVLVQFVVNQDGSVSDAVVVKSIGGGCDEEALRVVNNMPRWRPGRQNGQAVKVYFTLPIVFLLQ